MKTRTPKSRPPKTPKQAAGAPASKTGAAPRNRALALLLASGRVRLSQSGEPQEKEADRVADAVTSAASPAPAPEEERAGLPSIPASSTLSGMGPGRPLDPAARAMLEPRFGRDLGAVRQFRRAVIADCKMPLLFGRQPSAANCNQFMAAGFNDADLLNAGLSGGFNDTIPRQHHAVLVDDDRPACTDTMQRIDNHPDVARIVRAPVVRVRHQVAHVRRYGAGFGRRDTMIHTVNRRFDFWH